MGRKIKDMPRDEFRAMLTEKLHLDVSADADEETFSTVFEAKLSEYANRDVDNAVASGRILPEHRDFWLKSFKNNHIPARAALNALAPRRQSAAPSAQATASSAPLSASAAPAAPAVSEQTMSDAQADAELWAMGYRDGVEAPPQPKWWELVPPKEV